MQDDQGKLTPEQVRVYVSGNLFELRKKLLDAVAKVVAYVDCDESVPPHKPIPVHPATGHPLLEYPVCGKCQAAKELKEITGRVERFRSADWGQLLEGHVSVEEATAPS